MTEKTESQFRDYAFGDWIRPFLSGSYHKTEEEAKEFKPDEESKKLTEEALSTLLWQVALARTNVFAALATDVNMWCDKTRAGDSNVLAKAGAYVIHIVSLPILSGAILIEGVARQLLSALIIPFYYLRPPVFSKDETKGDEAAEKKTSSTEKADKPSKTLDERYSDLRGKVESWSEMLACGLSSAWTTFQLTLCSWVGGLNPFHPSIELAPSLGESSLAYIPSTILSIDGIASVGVKIMSMAFSSQFYFQGRRYGEPEDTVFSNPSASPALRALSSLAPERAFKWLSATHFEKEMKDFTTICALRDLRKYSEFKAAAENEAHGDDPSLVASNRFMKWAKGNRETAPPRKSYPVDESQRRLSNTPSYRDDSRSSSHRDTSYYHYSMMAPTIHVDGGAESSESSDDAEF